MKNRSVYIIFLGLSALLIFFSACVSEEKTKPLEQTTSTLVKETLKLATTTEMPTTTTTKTTVTTTPAEKKDDIRTKCIEETGEKNLDACMAAYAVQENDDKTCGKITSEEYRNKCYFSIGKKTKNSEDCDKITNGDERSMCLSIAEKDLSRCSVIASESLREDCMIESVTYKKDASVCGSKGTINYRSYCLTKYAVTYNNASACDPIDNADLRDDCYIAVGKENNNVEACLKVFIGSSEMCVIDVATELKDKSICEKISNDNDAYLWCLASLEKDISQCDKMMNEGGQNYCRVYVAKALKDTSICGIDLREWCYEALAIETGDLSLCANIESPSSEYFCYIFAKKSEAKMCSKIRPRTSVEWYKDKSRNCDGMAKDGNSDDGIALCRADADKYKDPGMGDKTRDDEIEECYNQLIEGVRY